MTLVVSAHKHTKTCFDCKKDVSSSWRVKNREGHYFCKSCFENKCQKKHHTHVHKVKECRECSVDVAKQWRFKYPSGEYHCQDCFIRKSQMPEMDYIPGPDETLSGRKHVRQWAVS